MTSTTTSPTIPSPAPEPAAAPWYTRLWARRLDRYPDNRERRTYLGIVLLITIMLYYLTYVQGTVAAQIMREFGLTFTQYVYVGVVGSLVGAVAAFGTGLADRWGRSNVVLGSMLITVLLIAFGLPNAGSKTGYYVIFALVSVAEGVALVASPALVRDFSPQLGRAKAMGFWVLGPVLGSIAATQVSSRTLGSHPEWRWQFYVAGAAGLVVWAVAVIGLRELSPRLRDQLMVTVKDRTLIEAKAAGIDPEEAVHGHWRQMLRPDIVLSSVAVGLYLLFYAVAAGFLVVYLVTVFGQTEAQANAVVNWYWIPMAIALIVSGVLSDRIRVRKPFIVFGTLVSVVGLFFFAQAATDPEATIGSIKLYLAIAGLGQGLMNATWMAGFTETVEKRNPAATATGLAVWGSTTRLIFTAALAIFPFAVSATTTLVEDGPRMQEISTTYAGQLAVLQTVDPATLAAMGANPNDVGAQAKALAALSGKSEADITKVITLNATYSEQLITASAIDQAVLTKMFIDPTNSQAAAEAVQQLAGKLGITPDQAGARLQALASVPVPDLVFLQANGPVVQQAGARLQSISQIPAADLAFMTDRGAAVQQASVDNPKQWRNWWWTCLIGQLLFLPSLFLLTGRWSPKRAREDQLEHDRLVQSELSRLRARA
ncbi:MFS transporter [Nocardia noduli]|uniref:MFS transporter n=1 Tax=Nocardia noduli TaxID=2815722 RepID=UPI001C239BC6|nr:MFS transporter [Nocardia noduli]